jgi:ATP-binding cassette subfamily B protein
MKQLSQPPYPMLKELSGFLLPYKIQMTIFLVALLITSTCTIGMGQGLKHLIDEGLVAQSLDYLNGAILICCGLAVVMALATYTRFYMISWLGERVCADIRRAVFKHVVGLHPGFFETHGSGTIVARLTTDTTLLQSIIGSGLSLALRSSVTFIGALIMLVVTDAKLALIVLVAVPSLLIPVVILGRRVRTLSRKSQDSLADVGSYAGEIIREIKVVQSYTRETHERVAFSHEVERAFEIALGRIRQRSLLNGVVILALFAALSALIWMGGGAVIDGSMSAGDLGAFLFYAVLIAMAVATLSEVFGDLQRAAGAADRLIELLHAQNMIRSGPLGQNASIDLSSAKLAFRRVTFNYDSSPSTPAIQNFSLIIEPGQVVAVVGPSGAGKSTLFDLIQRFYDPGSGEISIGGMSLKDFKLDDLRQRIGVVRQQLTIFSGTVQHNIAYGLPSASQNEIEAAAKAAQAHGFITSLPNGYKTDIGEQGGALSGGQCQRIAIARVFLKDPDILLLDEATSSLDAESEHGITRALSKLMKGRTTLIIAHRLATVMHADKIVLVDNGQMVGEGTHEQLISQSPLYRRLSALQFDKTSMMNLD